MLAIDWDNIASAILIDSMHTCSMTHSYYCIVIIVKELRSLPTCSIICDKVLLFK